MKKNKIFIALACIGIVLIGVVIIVNKNLWESKNKYPIAIMVGGLFATYEYIDRNIDIDYFYNLDADTTYEDLENEIGKPNGDRGSGLIYPYYQVGNQYVVVWFARDEDGMYTNISRMALYTQEEYVGDIPLKE